MMGTLGEPGGLVCSSSKDSHCFNWPVIRNCEGIDPVFEHNRNQLSVRSEKSIN